jgi:hypothetical protein
VRRKESERRSKKSYKGLSRRRRKTIDSGSSG